MSENKAVERFQKIVSSNNFLFISSLSIFLFSIFLRSIIDIGADTGVYLDLGQKIARGGKYYYTFFESNFPISFYIYALQYHVALFSGISPIIISEIFINFFAILSIFWSAKILKQSTIYNNRAHYNIVIISYILGFFIRANVIQLGEFGTKTSFLLICLFPYIAFSFERLTSFSRSQIFQRGILMGLIPCFKPHYLIFIIFIEAEKFWQKKSLKFFFELDKLIMILIGASYLFLMLKFTPDFFEFVVPMWPKIYNAYDNLKVFYENALRRLASEVAIFSFIFLAFSRLKFSANDKVLLLIFLAASVLAILENIGTIDQIGVLYAIFTICFLKIFYDLILSQKFSFRENKFIILTLFFWPIFDMEVLPKSIFGITGFINGWWLIFIFYPVIFIYRLRKNDLEKFIIFREKNLKIKNFFLFIFLYLALVFLALMSLKYLGAIGFVATNLFLLLSVLFCFEKFHITYQEKFSAFSIFVISLAFSCLIYDYIRPLSNMIPNKNYDTFPNKLSDKIAYYSSIYAPKKEDGFLVFSDLIIHQFPITNYLKKENYYVGNIVNVMPQRGFLKNSKKFPANKDQDKIFTLSYLFEDLKKKLQNKNVKILFINNNQKIFSVGNYCSVGFLEYYLTDPEFKKIFFHNFRFQNRILTEVAISNPVRPDLQNEAKEKDFFSAIKPAKEKVRYDFEVYVRKE